MLVANVDTRAWYRTGWVFVPMALAAGGVLVWAATARGKSSVSCPTVGPGGGVLADVPYLERGSIGTDLRVEQPMIVALAGQGQDPLVLSGLLAQLPDPVRVIAPKALLPDGTWFSSSDPSDAARIDAAASVADFISDLTRCRPTRAKPVVVGYGQGAELAYWLAAEHPDLLGAVIGVGGTLPDLPVQLTVPTTVIVGTQDAFVDVSTEQRATDRQAAGQPVAWIPVTGVGHVLSGPLALTLLGAAMQVTAQR